MEDILQNIKSDFNGKVSIKEKRPGIFQLLLPIYHEDGDMIDIFIKQKSNSYTICDFGLTLQRLSYTYDIDTDNKELILQRILQENGLVEENGNICMNTILKCVICMRILYKNKVSGYSLPGAAAPRGPTRANIAGGYYCILSLNTDFSGVCRAAQESKCHPPRNGVLTRSRLFPPTAPGKPHFASRWRPSSRKGD